ncbi:hypothetical protein T440DRAFT_479784 [Plenodomus tracheiphilus IPT5]|uniref:Uncharacterized protein n=1 Tax=Plenodomus tracheiphilus IPT5 TaxID=1408161 RepID=A0A6A7B5N6_9PLEO|nr:hypothetical protein T440DRAFT_479784 [Plenodomus tracheiphilus IPT5]
MVALSPKRQRGKDGRRGGMSTTARLPAGEFRLGDGSKRWENRRGRHTCSAARDVRSGEGQTTIDAQRADGGPGAVDGWLPEGQNEIVEARHSSQRNRRESSTQTADAFEASAAHTAGQASGAREGRGAGKCGDDQADWG